VQPHTALVVDSLLIDSNGSHSVGGNDTHVIMSIRQTFI
jgi:hypothetical protein